MPTPGPRRWRRWGLVAVAVVLVAVGVAVAVLLLHSPSNVSHPNVEFTTPTTTATTPPPKPKPRVDNFEWLRYGYDAGRTRDFVIGPKVKPPFRIGWRFEDFALLEFPPVIYGNTLYQMDDNGSAK